MSDEARVFGGSGGPLLGLDTRLYPVLAVIVLLLFGDMTSRLSGGPQPFVAPVAGADENPVSGNRRMHRDEWLATADYLDAMLAESGATSLGTADAAAVSIDEARRVAEGARLAAEAREDLLFGEAGFLLLAVFSGEPEFVVLNVLNKETRKRRVIEARVGESVNGYTIDAIDKLGLQASNTEGDRVSRALFMRQREAPGSG